MVDFLWYIIYRIIYLPVPWILWDHEMVYLPIWMVDFFDGFHVGKYIHPRPMDPSWEGNSP